MTRTPWSSTDPGAAVLDFPMARAMLASTMMRSDRATKELATVLATILQACAVAACASGGSDGGSSSSSGSSTSSGSSGACGTVPPPQSYTVPYIPRTDCPDASTSADAGADADASVDASTV